MLSRLRSLDSQRFALIAAVEAALVGLFFIQALRYLIGALYARLASASLYPALDLSVVDPALPGLVEPATASNELVVLAAMLLLPLITIVFGRVLVLMAVASVFTAAARFLMIGTEETIYTAMVIGGGLVYLSFMIRHRVHLVPLMFIAALSVDQLLRAFGDTLDPSWSTDYESVQLILSIVVVILSLISVFIQVRSDADTPVNRTQGLMTVWGGVAFGAMLFLQLSLLSLPNAVIGRSGLDYPDYVWVAPALVVATMLPLVPWVRGQARVFISLFDSSVRGWSWMLILMLLIVLGTRVSGVIGGISLLFAQFVASLLWWWMMRPRAEKERHFAGLWLLFGMLIFGLLVAMDVFTYEYAFVRDFADELAFLNDFVPPLLRGFRGLGLAVLLLSAFIVILPMSQTRRRIAWQGGSGFTSLVLLLLAGGLAAGTYIGARPPVVQATVDPEEISVATYNIHAGYNEFFYYDLEAIARTIAFSGGNVVLLQEVEAGRMTSFGVDQAFWLARRLGKDTRFYATNEGLQGLAVLSDIEIVFDDGNLLDSVGSQTGLQRVQVRPDEGVITLYNTWLDPLLDTGDTQSSFDAEASQQSQLSQIFGIVGEHHPDGIFGRMIIGGTFNNVPDSDMIQRLRDNNLREPFAGAPLLTSATFWRTGQRARLDYLWLTPNLADEVTGSLVIAGQSAEIRQNASDHRLAVVGIRLR